MALCLCPSLLLGRSLPRTHAKTHAARGHGQKPIGTDCLGLVDQNLAKGPDNYYLYLRFSSQHVKIENGDVLQYDIFLSPNNPEPKGGIDVNFGGISALREHHIPDQDGIDSHGDGLLTPAIDHWYSRTISLNAMAGHTTTYWTLVFEGDKAGAYAQFIDRIRITHPNGKSIWIYPSPQFETPRIDSIDGYARNFSLLRVPRSSVRDDQPVGDVIETIKQGAGRERQIESLADALNLVKALPNLTQSQQSEIAKLEQQTALLWESVRKPEPEFQAEYHRALQSELAIQPLLKSLRADLIGHAHIDVQWLWQSPESLQAAHNTWKQATIFMNEYPGFTFSQSSAGYYREVQKTWPDLFQVIQKYVKTGQWEILGGRECEADENLLSPEASASQFLYAQRYFRQEFGKTAVVGWEPDTFGHTAQMPQILKLGGCNYYYFCRGGKGDPLFYWQGLDGSRVLAYDEVAAGAWYDSPLDPSTPNEFPPYVEKTHQKEMMWVYGVGNHGGGPTREYIDQAESWMKQPLAPTVKFSTAQTFFQTMAKVPASQLPTINSELEGVFQGCYTTNSFEKKRNDTAEVDTVQAESISAVAHAFGGWPYPTDRLAQNWQKILFNQHHDTLCGSSFHWAYQQTIPDLDAVIADDKSIIRDAMVNLSVQVTPTKGGANFLVFNSLGTARSGWVTVYLPTGFGGPYPKFEHPIAVGPQGEIDPITQVDATTREAKFYAKDLPPYGYRVYEVKDSPAPVAMPMNMFSNEGSTLSNGKLTVHFDLENGSISSLTLNGHQFAGPAGLGRLIDTLEKGNPDAWNINPIVRVDAVKSIAHEWVHSFKGDGMKFTYELPPSQPGMKPTLIWQTFWLQPGQDHVDVDFSADWQVVSNRTDPSPFIRATFDSPTAQPVARYQVPFGVVTRPTDGSEGPVQAWADISAGDKGGVAVVVDCKHGFSCENSTLRMSLIRGCYSPDPLPNPGFQSAEYEIVPHLGSWQTARLSDRAQELVTDLPSIPVPPDAEGTRPLESSFANFSNPNMVATGLKMAEDGSGYVFRFFDSIGTRERGELSLNQPVSNAFWVNFIEDHQHPAVTHSNKIELDLLPWQIGNIEVPLTHRNP